MTIMADQSTEEYEYWPFTQLSVGFASSTSST